MGETFTNPLDATTNQSVVNDPDVLESLGADELMFYHSLRADLDLLNKSPKLQTIHYILDHSKSIR